MLTSIAMRTLSAFVLLAALVPSFGCKRNEPPPDIVKTQRDAMEKAKGVGETMQKGADAQQKKADEEGR